MKTSASDRIDFRDQDPRAGCCRGPAMNQGLEDPTDELGSETVASSEAGAFCVVVRHVGQNAGPTDR